MRLAARSHRIAESATVRAFRRAAELGARGVDVLDLSVGEPDFASPACAVAAARQALAGGLTKYTPSSGLPALRRAIAEHYRARHGAPWGAEQVVVTAGGKMALGELALALFEPGQEVVLNVPGWPSLAEQVRLTGADVVEVRTDAADGFRIHVEPLLAAIGPRTRAVLLNAPGNPTGGVIAATELRGLVAACAARGILVVADETYARLVYPPAEEVSAAAVAAEFPQTVAVVGSFSKTYAMTGWRVGYLLGPAVLLDAVAALQSHTTGNPTSFAMAGALAALEGAEADVARMLAEYSVRRDLVVRGLAELPGVRCTPPAGAFYAFPDVSGCYREGLEGSQAFAEYLLAEAAVAVVPGAAFGDDRHVRLSFACSRATLERAFARIAAALGARAAG
jgi:aspartate aminotransferase